MSETPETEPGVDGVEPPAVDTGDGTVEAVLAGVIDTLEAHEERVGALEALEERVAALEGDEAIADLPFPEWVERIAAEYNLETTFRGFETIPGLRAELKALHAAWLVAYLKDYEPKKGFLAASWHDSLTRVIERADWWRARAKRRTATD